MQIVVFQFKRERERERENKFSSFVEFYFIFERKESPVVKFTLKERHEIDTAT